jgi:hypothetical protein
MFFNGGWKIAEAFFVSKNWQSFNKNSNFFSVLIDAIFVEMFCNKFNRQAD